VDQPRPLEDVLVTVVENDLRTVYLCYLDRSGQWHWSGEGEPFNCGRITHWMPLPEPAR
jgi:hypothetical protein